jgi:hypothetical protein
MAQGGDHLSRRTNGSLHRGGVAKLCRAQGGHSCGINCFAYTCSLRLGSKGPNIAVVIGQGARTPDPWSSDRSLQRRSFSLPRNTRSLRSRLSGLRAQSRRACGSAARSIAAHGGARKLANFLARARANGSTNAGLFRTSAERDFPPRRYALSPG